MRAFLCFSLIILSFPLSAGISCSAVLEHATLAIGYPLVKFMQWNSRREHGIEEPEKLFGKSDAFHTALYFFLASTSLNSVATQEDGYDKAIEELKKKSNKKPNVLFIAGFDYPDEEFAALGNFKRLFLDKEISNTDYIHNFQDLKNQLLQLKLEGKKYDLIVFAGHGSKGSVEIPGSDKYLDSKSSKDYSTFFEGLVNKETVVLSIGCNALLGSQGHQFAKNLQEQLQSGPIIGAQREVSDISNNLNKTVSFLLPGVFAAKAAYSDIQHGQRTLPETLMYAFDNDWTVIRSE